MKKIFALFVALVVTLVLVGCGGNISAVSPAEIALGADWGITLAIQNATPTGVTLVIAQSGGDPTVQLSYGSEYALEVLKDGGWEAVPYIVDDEVAWTAEAITVNHEDSTENYINFENLYGTLSPGNYRIAKSFKAANRKGGHDTQTLFAEFEIIEGHFVDIKNWYGAVTGTAYDGATHEIELNVIETRDGISIEIVMVYPDKFPYKVLDEIGIETYTIADRNGNVITEGMTTETSAIAEDKTYINISTDGLPNGDYRLVVSELLGINPPEYPLVLSGDWEIDFQINRSVCGITVDNLN